MYSCVCARVYVCACVCVRVCVRVCVCIPIISHRYRTHAHTRSVINPCHAYVECAPIALCPPIGHVLVSCHNHVV